MFQSKTVCRTDFHVTVVNSVSCLETLLVFIPRWCQAISVRQFLRLRLMCVFLHVHIHILCVSSFILSIFVYVRQTPCSPLVLSVRCCCLEKQAEKCQNKKKKKALPIMRPFNCQADWRSSSARQGLI